MEADKPLKGFWPFTNLVRRCPECREPLWPKCGHCQHELPLTHNRLMRLLDRWSLRLAGFLLVVAILGALAWVNAWVWTGVMDLFKGD